MPLFNLLESVIDVPLNDNTATINDRIDLTIERKCDTHDNRTAIGFHESVHYHAVNGRESEAF